MNIPDTMMQNETQSWKDGVQYDNLNNQLSSGDYTLTYSLRGNTGISGAFGVDLIAVADGSGWQTTIATSDSAKLCGWYDWIAFVQKGSDATTRKTVGRGRVKFLQDISMLDPSKTGYDGRSENEIALSETNSAIRSVISAINGGDLMVEYTIASRTFKRNPTDQLLAALTIQRDEYSRIVAKERQKQSILNGDGDPRTITMRFRSPH